MVNTGENVQMSNIDVKLVFINCTLTIKLHILLLITTSKAVIFVMLKFCHYLIRPVQIIYVK